MRYITKKRDDSPRTRRAESEAPNNNYNVIGAVVKNILNKKQSYKTNYTSTPHTMERVSPPIIITIRERNLICFQPQEGIQLNFVKEDVRIGSHIF